MLQLSCLSGLGTLDDDVVKHCDGSCGGGGPCLLHSALCCPNDSLDGAAVVIELIEDKEILRDLAIAASLLPGQELPPPLTTGRHRHRNESIKAHAALLDDNDMSSWTAWTSTTGAAAVSPRLVVVPSSRKRDRSSSVMGDTRSWLSSLDMASIPTRRRSPNNNRRGGGNNGVQQAQGLAVVVSRRGRPRMSSSRLEKACRQCDSTETPHWRKGPDGPATLCNACGIRYTREQWKAAAAGVPPPAVGEPEQEGVVRVR